MKWRITGADRASGEDKTIVVDADDERQAQLRAKERNLLVEHVERDAPDYETINTPMKAVPEYRELRDANTGLYSSGQTMTILGYLALTAAVFVILAMFTLMAAAKDVVTASEAEAVVRAARIISLGGGAVTLVIFGVIFLWAGSMAKGVASMGDALRDLTINSHQR